MYISSYVEYIAITYSIVVIVIATKNFLETYKDNKKNQAFRDKMLRGTVSNSQVYWIPASKSGPPKPPTRQR